MDRYRPRMPIDPDTKDWTWVLERRCPECGFEASGVARDDLPALIRANVEQWDAVLHRDNVRLRPSDDRWSPLEYACHVRDVYRLYLTRLQLMLSEDNPTYPNWDQDETARAERYNEQDPARVARELPEAGAALANAFASVDDAGWQRTGRRSDGARFTVESFAKYLIHDPVHHIHDVAVDHPLDEHGNS